jgi:syndecan 1
MTADHGDNAVPNRFSQSADGESGRFEIVNRGYDRRQVDEHIAKLERTIGQQRSNHGPEKIGEFTGRLRSILEAAEEEAKDIRTQAREYARGEEEAARARLAELERRRDAVVTELGRVRGQLDEIMSRLGGTQATPPGTPPQGNPVPRPDSKPAARAEKSGPTPRTDQERQPVSPPPNGTPRATPTTPGSGTPLPSDPGRPTPRPAAGDGQRGGPTQRPTPQPPSVPQNVPGSPAASPSPKPRPTPSPRPRPGGPPTSGASGNGGGSSAFGAGAR